MHPRHSCFLNTVIRIEDLSLSTKKEMLTEHLPRTRRPRSRQNAQREPKSATAERKRKTAQRKPKAEDLLAHSPGKNTLSTTAPDLLGHDVGARDRRSCPHGGSRHPNDAPGPHLHSSSSLLSEHLTNTFVREHPPTRSRIFFSLRYRGHSTERGSERSGQNKKNMNPCHATVLREK